MFNFTNQVALVTGAGSAGGIGYAIARGLIAAGARVCITATTDRIHTRENLQDALYGLGAAHFAARVRAQLYDSALDAETSSLETSSGVAARTALEAAVHEVLRECEVIWS